MSDTCPTCDLHAALAAAREVLAQERADWQEERAAFHRAFEAMVREVVRLTKQVEAEAANADAARDACRRMREQRDAAEGEVVRLKGTEAARSAPAVEGKNFGPIHLAVCPVCSATDVEGAFAMVYAPTCSRECFKVAMEALKKRAERS